ncbi:RusA family crossover junction endodeoxyribonuclease [Tetragenococcus halophilus]|uniref:RusA family crossover junction endodeoxyribonuclease n=1 Tax=Tetragenococcus halophilus TaxID=51669 RepID=UPI0015B86F6F|nr:RusA family crossover junction endodeoxyribonuclease [Tetragenococcus halophilus]MDN6161618.1 RusA family crossover junction endodeoxyribonuclease [Atopostipes sp.]NWO00840.1 RusA family crossover junction endodeoxyribonuclease [Tetragenococcus halophilus]
MKIVIPGSLTDLNTYTNAERTNRYKGAKIKKQNTYKAAAAFMPVRTQKLSLPIKLHITWFCENRRIDPDNVAFAKKFLLDGMQEAGCLKNDGFNQIKGFVDEFEIDKENPRIEVNIIESE